VVVTGAPAEETPGTGDLVAEVGKLVARGTSRKDAVATVAGAHGMSKRLVYQAVLDADKAPGGDSTSTNGPATP
jgi:16S rRNA (cytidine1402-2'-O)-methyltransferase